MTEFPIPDDKDNKHSHKALLTGIFTVMFLSILSTVLIYWYENAKVRDFFEQASKRAKEHPIKKAKKDTTEFYKYIDYPTDTTINR